MSGSASAIFIENRDAGSVACLDPRVRLAATLAFMAVLVFLTRPAPLAAALAIGVATALWGRPPLDATLRRLAAVEGFLAVLLATLPFTVAGTEMFSVLGYPASWEGLQRAVAIVVRVNAAMLVIAALLSTMGSMRLAAAMAGICVPASIAHLFLLTVRFITVFHEEYSRLRRAMRARVFRAGSNRHSWRTLGNLVGMLLVRSVERAERVAWAMRCRGFSGQFPDFEQNRIGRDDIVFATAWTAGLFVLIALGIAA